MAYEVQGARYNRRIKMYEVYWKPNRHSKVTRMTVVKAHTKQQARHLQMFTRMPGTPKVLKAREMPKEESNE